jgi:amidase
VVPLAWSTDHVGIFARSVEDSALALGVLAGYDGADPRSIAAPGDDYLAAASPVMPRLGLLRSLLDRATPEMAGHVETIVGVFRSAGALVDDVELPPSYARVHRAGNTVVRAEAAAYHAPLFERHAARYPPKIREAILEGRAISAVEYLAARHACRAFRQDMAAIASRYDALLLPTTAAAAPRGLESTGDPYFCAPWTFSGMPAMALPSGVDAAGMPLSVQLVGAVLAESRLLGAAAWCERVIGFSAAPPL